LFEHLLLIALPAAPAIGAIVAGSCPERATRLVRAVGWAFSIVTLAAWIVLRAVLPEAAGGELLVSIHVHWVRDLGIGLHLGLDATGLVMAGMISFITLVAMVGTLPSLPELNRAHVVCLLLAEAGMLGVVTSWDLILFIAFWEVTLVPFFFLMGRGPTRGGVAAATRFVVTSVASSVLMWIGVLMLVKAAGAPHTFDLQLLAKRFGASPLRSFPSAWLFIPAFLVRMAAVPLHTWFPAAAANVPTAAAVLLAGGVLPLGGFGLVHVLVRLFGPGLCGVSGWLFWIGLITALGGALASVVQRDLKRLLAYVFLAQMGLALAGLTLGSPEARTGGLLLMVAAGMGGGCLFLFSGVVCSARGNPRIVDISGLWRSHPAFAGLAFAGIASAGAVPGTVGFAGAYLVLRSLSGNFIHLAVAAGAILIMGASALWAYRRVTGGSYHPEMWATFRWPRRRQVTVLAILCVAIVLAGLMPGLISGLRPTGSTGEGPLAVVTGHQHRYGRSGP
jgi:NADH-quinone oxidoreductase subunit M